MKIIDTMVIQPEEACVRYTTHQSKIDKYLVKILGQANYKKDKIFYELPTGNTYVNLKINHPFQIVCVYSTGITKGKIFELLADIEEKLLRIIERRKKLDEEAQEELFDFIERTVTYYCKSEQEVLYDKLLGSDSQITIESFKMSDMEDSLLSPRRSQRKKVTHTGTTRSQTLLNECHNNNDAINKNNNNNNNDQVYMKSSHNQQQKNLIWPRIAVFFLMLGILGFIFCLFYCGGYNFDECF